MENVATENTEELTEAQRLRRERFIQIGELPESYRTVLIIAAPDGGFSLQADNVRLWEIVGLLETALVQTRLQLQANMVQTIPDELDDYQQKLF